MAAQSGRNGAALSRQLQEHAHQFEFYQAVRLMHRLAPAREAKFRGVRWAPTCAPARRSSASAQRPRIPFLPDRSSTSMCLRHRTRHPR